MPEIGQHATGVVGEFAVYSAVTNHNPRTLLDILKESTVNWPDAAAVDDGSVVLSYRLLDREVARLATQLRAHGIGIGDRVGVRLPSGSVRLYLAILGVLAAGAAYVPVDAEDPDERAELVWREAGVSAVLCADEPVEWPAGQQVERRPDQQHAESAELINVVARPESPPGRRPGRPGPEDDAWIIFTSGSTGTPKGVAISHRSAAAFVDAEARLFLPHAPLGPGDRVLAGLSVAFDASCEEMWLAWRHGACLVPAARSLVRAGAELGPWLNDRRITVVSTVPTLAALWSPKMLDQVRLLIVGGEACPPDVARRFACHGREVWNTYGPTEATVVSCAARLLPDEPVRIGLPLDGWQLAVLGPGGRPVSWGEVGELVIGGVGLGRYLDSARDAEKFTALPMLGWDRGYRSGDLVRATPDGLEFVGRADNQVKIGGRRVELGEIEAALLALPGVAAATSVVRRTAGGLDVLVGYVVPTGGDPAGFDTRAATERLRGQLPAALVPRLAVLPKFPITRSGKVDRAALPWPLPADSASPATEHATQAAKSDEADEITGWLCGLWRDMLGVPAGPDGDFFALGGNSLAAARLISLLRARYPKISVADLYGDPTPAGLRTRLLDRPDASTARTRRRQVATTPRSTGWIQALIHLVLLVIPGLRWVLALGLAGTVWSAFSAESVLPALSWWVLVPAVLLMFTTAGRTLVAGVGARLVRGRCAPGTYRRGGATHLRLWAAERLVAAVGVGSILGTTLATGYARLLGCRVGKDVQLHALPPVTGLATFGDGCAVEPEADVAGWWLDGDALLIGEVRVGAGARIGTRAMAMPGATIDDHAELLPGACVDGTVPAGQVWSGSPARPTAVTDTDTQPETDARAETGAWPARPARRSPAWQSAYRLGAMINGLLLLLAAVPVEALAVAVIPANATPAAAALTILLWMPVMVLLELGGYALLLAGVIRLAGRAVRPGIHPADSRAGWSAWLVHRLTDDARHTVFPLYASLVTPMWLRLLGARIGRRAEVSTVLTLPTLLRVADSAFLADDVLAAPYELRRGWVRLGLAEVGERSFIGNSGIVGPHRTVSEGALVGVLSNTPTLVPAGSSWLGRPPMRLQRVPEQHDPARTFAPPKRLVRARAAMELCRMLPLILSGLLGLTVADSLIAVWNVGGPWLAVLLAGPVLYAAGWLAAGVTTAAKWLLIGRFTAGQHPLWSHFVWRNELYDTFVEMLALPWFVQPTLGTPALNGWLRSLGATIGRGVWCETYWLPEPDLIHIGEGATVNRGCVVQTHLFHDRVMRLDRVTVDRHATIGPHSIALPGSQLGEASTVGASSLVMAAETVPANTHWQGTPIVPAE